MPLSPVGSLSFQDNCHYQPPPLKKSAHPKKVEDGVGGKIKAGLEPAGLQVGCVAGHLLCVQKYARVLIAGAVKLPAVILLQQWK